MSDPRLPTIETHDREGIRILRIVEQRLGWTIDPRSLKSAMMGAIADATRVAVDFSQVSYLCSATIGTILSLNRDASAQGCRLVFCRMQPYVRDTFAVLRLDSLLTIVDTEEQALESLA